MQSNEDERQAAVRRVLELIEGARASEARSAEERKQEIKREVRGGKRCPVCKERATGDSERRMGLCDLCFCRFMVGRGWLRWDERYQELIRWARAGKNVKVFRQMVEEGEKEHEEYIKERERQWMEHRETPAKDKP